MTEPEVVTEPVDLDALERQAHALIEADSPYGRLLLALIQRVREAEAAHDETARGRNIYQAEMERQVARLAERVRELEAALSVKTTVVREGLRLEP